MSSETTSYQAHQDLLLAPFPPSHLTHPNKNTLGSRSAAHPRLIYGTAWKGTETASLVYAAIKAGFQGIDAAAQPQHYNERSAGDGIRRAVSEGLVRREDLWIQTKFIGIESQAFQLLGDEERPYDPDSSIEDQVRQSISGSLKNLATTSAGNYDATVYLTRNNTDPGRGDPSKGEQNRDYKDKAVVKGPVEDQEESYLDCVLLHAQLRDLNHTMVAWKTLSSYVPHRIRSLGIANATPMVLDVLLREPVPPVVVQQRFAPHEMRYSKPIREMCEDPGRSSAIVRSEHDGSDNKPSEGKTVKLEMSKMNEHTNRLWKDGDYAEFSRDEDAGSSAGEEGKKSSGSTAVERQRPKLIFQAFWTLTANQDLVYSEFVGQLALQAEVSRSVALYALILGLGNMSILNGTTSELHMYEDLEDLDKLSNWLAAGTGKSEFERALEKLREIVG